MCGPIQCWNGKLNWKVWVCLADMHNSTFQTSYLLWMSTFKLWYFSYALWWEDADIICKVKFTAVVHWSGCSPHMEFCLIHIESNVMYLLFIVSGYFVLALVPFPSDFTPSWQFTVFVFFCKYPLHLKTLLQMFQFR